MVDQDRRVTDPAAHQPTKADLEEDVAIDATPEALAWAVTRVGAKRREDRRPPKKRTASYEGIFPTGHSLDETI